MQKDEARVITSQEVNAASGRGCDGEAMTATKAQRLRETACPGTYRNFLGDRRSRMQRKLKMKKKKRYLADQGLRPKHGSGGARAKSRKHGQDVSSRLDVRRKRWDYDGGGKRRIRMVMHIRVSWRYQGS